MGWVAGWVSPVFGGIVEGFERGWWQVRGAAVRAAVVVPVDVLQGGDLDVVAGPPRPAGLDQLVCERAVTLAVGVV